MFGTLIPFLLSQDEMPPRSRVEQEDLARWLSATQRLEQAHRVTLAWFRSRLPGYPLIPAPQLGRETAYTTHEYSPRFIWTPDERGLGLQMQSHPPAVEELLGASSALSRRLQQTARDMCRELSITEVWVAFMTAHRALNAEARADLASAKRDLRRRLAPAAVDSHEPRLALDRAQYRSHHTTEVVEQLSGIARVYSDAFSAVEDLIEFACTDVFADLALFGEPKSVEATNVVLREGHQQTIDFDADDQLFVILDARQVVWLKGTSIKDAVLLQGYQFTFNQVDNHLRFHGRILERSAEDWPHRKFSGRG